VQNMQNHIFIIAEFLSKLGRPTLGPHKSKTIFEPIFVSGTASDQFVHGK
jgi:hypothetical protein